MTEGLPDFGYPAAFRVLDGSKMAGGVVAAAPAGYEWVQLPGGGGMLDASRVLMCVRCAGLVLVAAAHDAWHDDLHKSRWRRQT